MFKPVAMLRLSAVVLDHDKRAVLRDLGQAGAVQLTRTSAGSDTAPLPPRDRSTELARCDRLIARVEELRQNLAMPAAAELPGQADALSPAQAEDELCRLETRAGELLERRRQLAQRWGELTAVCEKVSSYRGLEIPLDQLDSFSFLHFVTGSLPAGRLERLLEAIGEGVALLPLPEHEGRQPIIAMTSRGGRAALDQALQQAGFQREILPAAASATPDTLSQESLREQKQVAAGLEQTDTALQTLASELARPLALIERAARLERRLLEAEQNFPRTEAATLLTGWVPAAEAPALETRVREVTNGRCVFKAAAPEDRLDERIPILLRHPRLLRPFEMLVSAYGLPKYQELEPTLFVAMSYLLMFGMMFGDAGHGAILAAGGLAARRVGRGKALRDGGLLLLFAGLSSMMFGCIYGSCFGLAAFKKYALWHDPLEGDPMGLMSGAIGIGVVMISLGLILNVINRFRRGDVIGGFLDKFGVIGVLFYWGALALITKYAALESRGLVKPAIIFFLAVPLAGWAVKEPLEYFLHRRAGHSTGAEDGLLGAVIESLVGAFEAVLSYLANTISFVRLAAYAMSHAALLLAAFMMAAEVKRVSVGGGLLSVLVIILGNVVAIVLEGIIASVQALRLEYYEFFGKFFSGSGRPFTPFRLAADESTSI